MTGSATRPPTKPPTKPNATNEHGTLPLSPRLEARTPQEASGAIPRHPSAQRSSGGMGGNARPADDAAPGRSEDAPPTDRPRGTGQTAHDQRVPCFYCGRQMRRFDRDHSPIPDRHGGTETVKTCRHCHVLKDTSDIRHWSPAEHDAVIRGATAESLLVARYCLAAMQGEDVLLDPRAIVDAAATCTTPEAKIAVYKAFNAALDHGAVSV